jgi:hypothetical protein
MRSFFSNRRRRLGVRNGWAPPQSRRRGDDEFTIGAKRRAKYVLVSHDPRSPMQPELSGRSKSWLPPMKFASSTPQIILLHRSRGVLARPFGDEGSGGYATQIDFGWTNGVLTALTSLYPDLKAEAAKAVPQLCEIVVFLLGGSTAELMHPSGLSARPQQADGPTVETSRSVYAPRQPTLAGSPQLPQ